MLSNTDSQHPRAKEAGSGGGQPSARLRRLLRQSHSWPAAGARGCTQAGIRPSFNHSNLLSGDGEEVLLSFLFINAFHRRDVK